MEETIGKGYFVGIGKGVEDSEAARMLGSLDSLLQEIGATVVRRYEVISSVYALIPEEAVERLVDEGYIVEQENMFRALRQEGKEEPSAKAADESQAEAQ